MSVDYMAIVREFDRTRTEARKREAVGALGDAILEALANGSRLRPRELAERVGEPLDVGNPAVLLRVLPGRELFDALARLLDRDAIETDTTGEFWIRKEVDAGGSRS